MGLDDKVFSETNAEQDAPRNENLEGGKSTTCHEEEAKQEKKLAKREDKPTEPAKDPDEVKSSASLLPEDAERKSDLSSGDSK
jgi:hypothetical protein